MRRWSVLETITFAISTELLQSLLSEKFRGSKNDKAIQAERETCLCRGGATVLPIPPGQEAQKLRAEPFVLSQNHTMTSEERARSQKVLQFP